MDVSPFSPRPPDMLTVTGDSARSGNAALGRTASRLVWAVVTVELLAAAAVSIAWPPTDVPAAGMVAFYLLVVTAGGVGALVTVRQPRNAIGWILWVVGTVVAMVVISLSYIETSTLRASGTWLGTVALGWAMSWSLQPTLAAVVLFVPLLFPNGRLPSPRWRPVLWIEVLAAVILTIPAAFRPGVLNGVPFDNPFGIAGIDPFFALLDAVGPIVFGIGLVGAIAGARSRYRHGTEIERRQLRWFGASLVVVGILVSTVFVPVPRLADNGWIFGLFGLSLVPVAIGVAVLRYRLYDIDRIISRGIAWLILSVILAGSFVIVIVGLQAVLARFTTGSTLAVAASTLVAAAMFQPVRARVQRSVDRRFNRSRVDAERAIGDFGRRARDEVDLAPLLAAVLGTAQSAVTPSQANVWLRGDR